MTRSFDDLFAMAAARKGGRDAFEKSLTNPKTPAQLARVPDDRWLSVFSKCVFQSGFNWKVVDSKWPRFETLFHGFDPGRNALMSDDEFDGYLQSDGIIRHAKKILSIRDNAIFFRNLAREHGSAAQAFANWPVTEYADLLWMLKKRGSRLGGHTGMYALRFCGADSFITSRDVTAALIREGIIDRDPTSKSDLARVQTALNTWSGQSGRPLTHISRVLACTVD